MYKQLIYEKEAKNIPRRKLQEMSNHAGENGLPYVKE